MSDELDETELAEELARYYKEIEAEFDAVKAGDTVTIQSQIRKRAQASAFVCIDSMVDLAKNASSENVKLAAQKEVIRIAAGDMSLPSGASNPMEELLNRLTQNDPSEVKAKKTSTSETSEESDD